MKKIVYSPDYKEKLEIIRDWLDLRFGSQTRTKHMAEIKKHLNSLKEFPAQGLSVRAMFGVDSNSRWPDVFRMQEQVLLTVFGSVRNE